MITGGADVLDAGIAGVNIVELDPLDQLLTYPMPAHLNAALVAQRDSALTARDRARGLLHLGGSPGHAGLLSAHRRTRGQRIGSGPT